MELKNNNSNLNSNRFNVVIRIRPDLKLKNEERKDLTSDSDLFISVKKLSEKEVELQRTTEERIFQFDRIIEGNSSQAETYSIIGEKIVDDVLEGYNGTLMAYGQTGSGKTYTIFGNKKSMDSEEIMPDTGLVHRVIRHIFNHIKEVSQFVII